jgi:hypothetical protein
MLLDVAYRGEALFEGRCQVHGVGLNFAALKRRQRGSLLKSYPFKLLEPFLDESVGLEPNYWDFREGRMLVTVESDDDDDSTCNGWCDRRHEYMPVLDEPLDSSSNSSY